MEQPTSFDGPLYMPNTLLIIGASGLTGYKAFQLGKKRFNIYGTYNMRSVPDAGFLKLELKDDVALKRIFNEIRPDYVLNATALHDVDYCESHPDEAFLINSKMVELMVDQSNHYGARFIHLSTDYVFAGKQNRLYNEDDVPNPANIYASSKLCGEMQAKKAFSYCILRPSVVYGWSPFETFGPKSSSGKPMNFALWALTRMKMNEVLSIVNDQFSTPTLADILAAISLRAATFDKDELYHVSGISCMSRFQFVRKIAEVMGYSQEQIRPVETATLSQRATRPLRCCLDCSKVQSEFQIKLPEVEQSLFIMRMQIEEQSPSLLGN
jgi:dTDP-4-dehydrorhamnose reductase